MVGFRAFLRRGTPRKPRIGIVGFYGHGNYGDELFFDVFRQYLEPEFELVNVVDLPVKPYYSRPLRRTMKSLDAIVIGGGDLIRPWTVDHRYFNPAYLTKPVFIIGVGVGVLGGEQHQTRPQALAKYQAFLQHPSVKFIGTRDENSRKWVERNVQPTAPLIEAPDIVCALTLPPAQTAAGAPILGLVTRQRPNREVPDDYGQIERLARQMLAQGWRIRHIILGTGIVGERDIANASDLKIPEKEIVRSENLDDLSRAIGECTALASMKFHGSVVATMYGVPSMVLIPTAKNQSFMRRIDRADLLSKFQDERLAERFSPVPPPHSAATVAQLRAGADAVMRDLRTRIAAELQK